MVRSLSLLIVCAAATLGCASVAQDTRKDAPKTPGSEPQNDAMPAAIASLLVTSGVAGLGVGLLVDANHVHESDRSARLYNATGPTGARGIGVTLIVLGVLFTGPIAGILIASKAPPPERKMIATSPPGAPPERPVPPKAASPARGVGAAAQVAISPEDAASAAQATQAAREACRKACSARCGNSEACDSKCVEEACK